MVINNPVNMKHGKCAAYTVYTIALNKLIFKLLVKLFAL